MQEVRTLFTLMLAGSLVAGCITTPDDDDDTLATAGELLPDGTPGVDRIEIGGQVQEVHWIAREGMKFVDEDFAIGPALAGEVDHHATSKSISPWTNGVVPYCMHGLDASEQTTVRDALATLMTITPLTFNELSCTAAAAQGRYLDYTQNLTLSASRTINGVGHPTGTTIEFTPSYSQRTVWHETGHAIGYMHEQRRSDRAQYLNYYESCMDDPTNNRDQFQIEPTSLNWSPYDVTSIMQYPSDSFSIDTVNDPTTCPVLLYGYPNPATAPFYMGTNKRGALITKSPAWSDEDINGAWQIYEPKLGVAETNDRYGTRVAAGDFDGDGYQDLAVTALGEAPGSSISSGAVLLYKGTMNGLTAWRMLTEADFGVTQRTADGFGAALLATDIDGDGDAELIVGAQQYGASRGGGVFVYLGHRGEMVPLSTVITQSASGAGTSESGDLFGASLAFGRFTGGSAQYIAVGAPGENGLGTVQLFHWNFGSPTFHSTLWASQATTAASGDLFGWALGVSPMSGGDYLVVGAPQIGTGAGMAIPFFAHSGAMTPGTPIPHSSSASGDRFGYAIATGQVVFGGSHVVVIGAPGRASATGRAYVYNEAVSGAGTTFTQASELKQADVPGETGVAGDSFGSAIVLGDLDGDTLHEIVIGVPHKTVQGLAGVGAIDVFYSSSRPNAAMRPGQPTGSDAFGTALAIGNFDAGAQSVVQDHHLDLIVGQPGRRVSNANGAGAVNSYLGPVLGLARQLTEEITGGPM